MHEFTIRTSVEVDLNQIPTSVLKDELEDRGHLVDNSDLDVTSVPELIDELNRRNARDWERLSVRELIKALEWMRCPDDILKPLNEWEHQPVVDNVRWDKWLAMCGRTL